MELHDRNKEIDYMLKRECQKAFEKRFGRKTFMRIFGKSYLLEDEGNTNAEQDSEGEHL